MPRKKPSFNRADVRAAWRLMEDAGLEPVAVTYRPDGGFRILTKKYVEARYGSVSAAAAQVSEWDEVLSNARV